jgi:HrpA-like RNA helicase
MHPVQDHYLEEILPNLPSSYQPTSRPSKKLSQPQIDRMRASFMARGIDNERTLSALESLTRSERIDYNLVGAVARYCIEKSKGTEGGVLVFMPGVFEIKQAVEAIRSAVPHVRPLSILSQRVDTDGRYCRESKSRCSHSTPTFRRTSRRPYSDLSSEFPGR